jgi:hypothetical protein
MADQTSILQAAQNELKRHNWDTFVENPPSIAQEGKGVVVPGCSVLQETDQYDQSVCRALGK